MRTRALVPLLLFLLVQACGGAQPSAPSSGHRHGAVEGHFQSADQWAPVFDDPKRDAWQQPERVVDYLALAPGMTVADIGAGTGYFEKRLSDAVGPSGKVLALDVEPDMVRYMRERAAREGTANVEPRVVPFDDPQLPAGSVDRILIVDTWHHVQDRDAYAAKLAAALKPDGFLLIVDFTLDSPIGPAKSHRLAPEVVAAELNKGGLHAAVLEPGIPHQYIMKGVPQ
jgi:ubiquinone/menaquinone biosynthesis C-methylase UbiE